MIEIGVLLRKYRHEKRLSMESIADSIGITYQALQTYEVGKVKLIHPIFFKLCEILEVDPCTLIRETSEGFKYKLPETEQKVMEVLPEYVNDTIKELKADLRDRDEQIGALKYQLSQLQPGANNAPGSKKAG